MKGQTLSHYRVIEVVGQGASGIIYKAEDLALGRLVALKCLPSDLRTERLSGVALPARGADRIGDQPSQHLHDLRDRRTRRPPVHRHGMARREDACRPDRSPAAEARTPAGLRHSRSPTASTRRTPRASCIATSSRRTSSSRLKRQAKILDFGISLVMPSPLSMPTGKRRSVRHGAVHVA